MSLVALTAHYVSASLKQNYRIASVADCTYLKWDNRILNESMCGPKRSAHRREPSVMGPRYLLYLTLFMSKC